MFSSGGDYCRRSSKASSEWRLLQEALRFVDEVGDCSEDGAELGIGEEVRVPEQGGGVDDGANLESGADCLEHDGAECGVTSALEQVMMNGFAGTLALAVGSRRAFD